MEVILREDIDKLGTRGQVVKVAAGYARNFLLPKRLAVAATESNKKIVEQERQAYLRKEAKLQSEAQDLANLMTGVSVTITQNAGENDQLFGSVTSKDVADALVAKGYTIDRRKVQLDEPIKQLGEFKVPVRLHKEVTVELTVVVAKEEAKVVVAKDETKKEEAKEEPKKEEAKEE
jgi:large subunit ribosomal protein L9